jgi:hypothetical protein
MQFSFTYPMATGDHDPALTTRNGMYSVLAAAEAGGFGAVGFTDHPIPSRRWLEAGGHETLDPFAALAFCAAATEQIRLMTNVAVVPYRNPFLVAKMVATVDVLSDGRAILGAGTGYLRSEYRALGVDFDKRNELFEEALEAIISSWSGDEVTLEGSHFHASGNQARAATPSTHLDRRQLRTCPPAGRRHGAGMDAVSHLSSVGGHRPHRAPGHTPGTGPDARGPVATTRSSRTGNGGGCALRVPRWRLPGRPRL